MRRGQTTTVAFNTNINLESYDKVVLTIEDTYPIKEKQAKVHVTAGEIKGTQAVFDLKQADTLALRAGTIKMQVRAATNAGQAVTSNILTTLLQDALKEEEI